MVPSAFLTSDVGPPVVAVLGPTASGKSALAEALAERLSWTPVALDSAQVYRGLDIGSAKPDSATRARLGYRMLDVVEPEEVYTAARYAADARREIAALRAAGRGVVVVGGTLLYHRALFQGLASLPAADPQLRAELRQRFPDPAAMHAELARLDPPAAARIHRNDPQRLLRALEVCKLAGVPLSTLQRAKGDPAPWPVLNLARIPERAALHAAIAGRLQAMLAAGFLDEARALRARPGFDRALPAYRSVGYAQAFDLLDGRVDHAGFVERVLAATRQLAKRQITWLRSMPDLHVLPQENTETVAEGLLRQYVEAQENG